MYVSFISWFIYQPIGDRVAEAPLRQATKQNGGKETLIKVTEKMSGLLRLMSGYLKNVAK
jgi:hypothetical protein